MAAPARSAHDTIRTRFTSPFPAIVHVELTNECNLDCPMCARTTSMTRPVQHMPDTMFRRVVDELQGKASTGCSYTTLVNPCSIRKLTN